MPQTPINIWRVKYFFTTLEKLYPDYAGTSSGSEITASHPIYSIFGQQWLLKIFFNSNFSSVSFLPLAHRTNLNSHRKALKLFQDSYPGSQSIVYAGTFSFIKSIRKYMEYILCARYCTRHLKYNLKPDRSDPVLMNSPSS